jgi:hypothetical protein
VAPVNTTAHPKEELNVTTRDLITHSQALWYAWGRADQGAKLTGSPAEDGGDPAFGFAVAWADVAGEYDDGSRGSLPSVQAAFAAWQEDEEF